MTSRNTICIRCGKVQTNFDFNIGRNQKYIMLKRPLLCPKCRILTSHIATGDIEVLRKELEKDPSGPCDSYIIKLVKW